MMSRRPAGLPVAAYHPLMNIPPYHPVPLYYQTNQESEEAREGPTRPREGRESEYDEEEQAEPPKKKSKFNHYVHPKDRDKNWMGYYEKLKAYKEEVRVTQLKNT